MPSPFLVGDLPDLQSQGAAGHGLLGGKLLSSGCCRGRHDDLCDLSCGLYPSKVCCASSWRQTKSETEPEQISRVGDRRGAPGSILRAQCNGPRRRVVLSYGHESSKGTGTPGFRCRRKASLGLERSTGMGYVTSLHGSISSQSSCLCFLANELQGYRSALLNEKNGQMLFRSLAL